MALLPSALLWLLLAPALASHAASPALSCPDHCLTSSVAYHIASPAASSKFKTMSPTECIRKCSSMKQKFYEWHSSGFEVNFQCLCFSSCRKLASNANDSQHMQMGSTTKCPNTNPPTKCLQKASTVRIARPDHCAFSSQTSPESCQTTCAGTLYYQFSNANHECRCFKASVEIEFSNEIVASSLGYVPACKRK